MPSKDSIKTESSKPVAPAVASRGDTAKVPAIVTELTRELSRRERLVLMLRYTEELTITEIAAVLEIASIEVERILENIRSRVQRRLAPTYGRAAPRLA